MVMPSVGPALVPSASPSKASVVVFSTVPFLLPYVVPSRALVVVQSVVPSVPSSTVSLPAPIRVPSPFLLRLRHPSPVPCPMHRYPAHCLSRIPCPCSMACQSWRHIPAPFPCLSMHQRPTSIMCLSLHRSPTYRGSSAPSQCRANRGAGSQWHAYRGSGTPVPYCANRST
jgi:hypothetical protein